MNRIRIIGLALVAVFAISAVAVASASAALPEFRQCQKVAIAKTGEWNNNICTEKNATKEGEFEKLPIKNNIKFTSTSGESVLKAGFGSVKCKKDKDSGETVSPTHITVTVTFEECKDSLARTCTTAGQAAGVIKTFLLKGWLIYLNPPTNTTVGIFLDASVGTKFATWECGTEAFEVKSTEFGHLKAEPEENSCVAGEVFPKNVEQETGELKFKENTTTKQQEFRKFEYELTGGVKSKLICELESKHGGTPFEKGTETTTDTIKWEPAGTKVEVKG